MLITLTISMKEKKLSRDIQANYQQKISEVLKILEENMIFPEGCVHEGIKIRSLRRGEYVPVNMSFEQAGINAGDVLEIL